jgi:hypothetical protein
VVRVAYARRVRSLCLLPVESRPINRQMIVVEKRLERCDGFVVLRGDGIAFTRDFRSDSLRELAEGAIVDEQSHLGLAQHVDKTGSDDLPRGVDYLGCARIGQISDGFDPIAAYSDVGGIAAAIEDVPILDSTSKAGGSSV